MRTQHYAIVCTLILSAQAHAQSIANPGFESACTFDVTGWDRFCSSPDYYYGDGHNCCYSLALPTSDSNSPCFSSGSLIGMHTLMSGVQAGVPYELSLYENMSSPEINSDCGIFAVPAGQTPADFNGTTPLNAWPVGFSNPGVWMQDIMNFTIPEQYAGMDFCFFIEYSAAPDIVPGMKYFDDITITDLSTGAAQLDADLSRVRPNPAIDKLWVDVNEAPIAVSIHDVTGRVHVLSDFRYTDRTLEVNVGSIPPGMLVMLVKTASGIRTVRFIKG